MTRAQAYISSTVTSKKKIVVGDIKFVRDDKYSEAVWTAASHQNHSSQLQMAAFLREHGEAYNEAKDNDPAASGFEYPNPELLSYQGVVAKVREDFEKYKKDFIASSNGRLMVPYIMDFVPNINALQGAPRTQ